MAPYVAFSRIAKCFENMLALLGFAPCLVVQPDSSQPAPLISLTPGSPAGAMIGALSADCRAHYVHHPSWLFRQAEAMGWR